MKNAIKNVLEDIKEAYKPTAADNEVLISYTKPLGYDALDATNDFIKSSSNKIGATQVSRQNNKVLKITVKDQASLDDKKREKFANDLLKFLKAWPSDHNTMDDKAKVQTVFVENK